MPLFLLLLGLFSFLFTQEGEFEKIRNSLVDFEESKVVEFVFFNEQDDYLKLKKSEENKQLGKIVKENPEFSTSDREVLYFDSYWRYKKDWAKLEIIDNAINEADKKISTEEKNYLKTYLNLLKANVWLLFKKNQDRAIDKSIFSLLPKITPPLPRSKSTLREEYLKEYYAFYGEINSILAKVRGGLIDFLLKKRDTYNLEAEIYFFKATKFEKQNNRGLLLYILNGIFFKNSDYFFIYNVKKNLKNLLKRTQDSETLFITNVILANLYYEKNDLSQSWKHIQLAKKNNQDDDVIQLLEKNFLNRKPTLINL